MLKYLLFIVFFAVLIVGYFSMNVPAETPFAEVLTRVERGMCLVFIGGLGSLTCLYRITR